MNEWKELEIGNIPSDFFVNDNYEIQRVTIGNVDRADTSSKIWIIEKLLSNYPYNFRYRLKPLETIRVTRKIWKSYCHSMGYVVANLESDGRKVEIIDE